MRNVVGATTRKNLTSFDGAGAWFHVKPKVNVELVAINQ